MLKPKVRVIKSGDQNVSPFEINLATDFSLLNVVITGVAADDGAYWGENDEIRTDKLSARGYACRKNVIRQKQ